MGPPDPLRAHGGERRRGCAGTRQLDRPGCDRLRGLLTLCLTPPTLFGAGVAAAQSNPLSGVALIRNVSLPEFSRDRNQSVLERSRPDFDPIGVQVGSFVVNPQLGIANGATDNVLLADNAKRGDIVTVLQPALRIASDFSRHRIILDSAGDLRRYARTPGRNQNAGYVNFQTRIDVTQRFILVTDAQVSRVYESPFTEDLAAGQTFFSRYTRRNAAVRGVYSGGRLRGTAIVDRNSYSFSALELAGGVARSQQQRDRTVDRVTALVEYGVTPTVAFYGQTVYDRTGYPVERLPDGTPNRDSDGLTVLGGMNFDVAGLMRGAVGVGYTARNYFAPEFRDAGGVSVQTRLDFFPTQLTTVGVSLQRQIQDANLGNSSAYIDNRIGIDVDHELLQNLIVSANVSQTRRSYVDLDSRTRVFLAGVNASFQMTRSLSFGFNTGYGQVRSVGDRVGTPSTEWRGQLSMRIRR